MGVWLLLCLLLLLWLSKMRLLHQLPIFMHAILQPVEAAEAILFIAFTLQRDHAYKFQNVNKPVIVCGGGFN